LRKSYSPKILPNLGLALLAFTFASLLGLFLGITESNEIVRMISMAGLGIIFVIVILAYPIIGIALTVTSTPIAVLLPPIPVLSSIVPLIGILTLVAYFLQRRQDVSPPPLALTKVEWLALVWILWVFISNPQVNNFNNWGLTISWMLTLFQLWMLLWLAKRMMQSENAFRVVMTIFAIGILISAFSVVQQTRLGIFDLAERATGLSGGANTASRYFAYGIIILGFLQGQRGGSFIWRVISLVGIGILMVSIFYTGSRSGILILGVALFLLAMRLFKRDQRSLTLWLVLLGGIIWLIIVTSGTIMDPNRVAASIISGSDTVGLRYDLWKAGLHMWIAHPITGVGIGQYGNFLMMYWNATYMPHVFTSHNTYVQVLAETGIVGFVLFSLTIVIALRNFWLRSHAINIQFANLNWMWFILLIVLLLGGITKTDVADKFLWFMLGLSSSDSWV